MKWAGIMCEFWEDAGGFVMEVLGVDDLAGVV